MSEGIAHTATMTDTDGKHLLQHSTASQRRGLSSITIIRSLRECCTVPVASVQQATEVVSMTIVKQKRKGGSSEDLDQAPVVGGDKGKFV